MPTETKVQIGPTTYTVRPLTIGQLEELTELFATAGTPEGTPNHKVPGRVLAIASASMTPAIPDVSKLETDLDELSAVMKTILAHSGIATETTKASTVGNVTALQPAAKVAS